MQGIALGLGEGLRGGLGVGSHSSASRDWSDKLGDHGWETVVLEEAGCDGGRLM